jgi:nitrogenase molybdenum-iron protein alpha/beta subunit
MKGLLRRLTPFAPDQSGAAAALYELGGILVICDAGGCAGNVCGFDEPRWFQSRSAIFSAGLRDMDAILGRDDKLIGKLQSAAEEIGAAFAAVIGTPVPAVIGTDFRALRRMGENRLGIPVLSIPATGVRLYDEGAAEAYVQLFRPSQKKNCRPTPAWRASWAPRRWTWAAPTPARASMKPSGRRARGAAGIRHGRRTGRG